MFSILSSFSSDFGFQVDLEHDCRSVYVLAYVADVVKPHIKDYVDADLFYEDYIGTDTLQVGVNVIALLH